jgi:hypothetical protein
VLVRNHQSDHLVSVTDLCFQEKSGQFRVQETGRTIGSGFPELHPLLNEQPDFFPVRRVGAVGHLNRLANTARRRPKESNGLDFALDQHGHANGGLDCNSLEVSADDVPKGLHAGHVSQYQCEQKRNASDNDDCPNDPAFNRTNSHSLFRPMAK